MMTKEEQQNQNQEIFMDILVNEPTTAIMKDNNKQIDNDHNNDTNFNVNKTKYKLSFSIDRMLNNSNSNNPNNRCELPIKNGADQNFFSFNCNQTNCCKNLNQITDLLSSQKIHLGNQLGLSVNSGELIKSIVRPTPIRIRKTNSAVLSNQLLPYTDLQTILKYQQNNSSTGLNPLNSLKSLQKVQLQQLVDKNPRQVVDSSSSTGNSIVNRSSGLKSSQQTSPISSKRKRSWSRAVFSNLQRKGLEIQFQQQKYITKPDRRKLANRLNLTDAQVKVWFQNRRMKWRHTRENLKSGHEKSVDGLVNKNDKYNDDDKTTSEDEIDVVAE